MRRSILLVLAALAGSAYALEYPPTARGDVVDDYHGTKVADPYRWLEDVDSKETAEWIRAQNKVSQPLLAKLPQRDAIKKRLTELWNFERYGVPERKSGRLFYTRHDGLQNQPVLYVQDTPDAEPRVLLDPNKLSADGTVALTQWKVAPGGAHVAYGLAQSGSDWNEFKVLDVASGKPTDDALQRIKFSGISWTRDGRGFFYSRYPDAPKAEAGKKDAKGTVFEDLASQRQQLYYHRLGTKQSEDVLIYERPDQSKLFFDGEVTDDGRFLFIKVGSGTESRNALFYKYLGDPLSPKVDGPVKPLVERIESLYEPIGSEGSIVYLLTTSRAPKKRVVAVDLRAPDPKHWIELVPQGDDPIEDALVAGKQFVVVTLHHASHRLKRYAFNGNPLPELKLPGLGSIAGIHGEYDATELFYSYTDFKTPPQNHRCDLARGRCEVFQPVKLKFDPNEYTTEQVFYRSNDGTRVPMFLTYRKGWDRRKDGPKQTLLHAYGGFEYSNLPSFARPELAMQALAWLDNGGVYAVANIRGGGEYGKVWHQAAIKEKRQNAFDDFINAAHYLIKQGWTTTPQLAIHGRSNGGVLVGVVLNQKPELFGAAIADVGVMDMLRFHKFTIGWAWVDDYGSSDDPKGFRYLHKYSPYHNIKPGTKYPAVIATTADHDDRVVPGHSFKYIAALQAAQAGDKPVIIRIDVKAGHASGKPTAKLIDEIADKVAFALEYTKAAGAPAAGQ